MNRARTRYYNTSVGRYAVRNGNYRIVNRRSGGGAGGSGG